MQTYMAWKELNTNMEDVCVRASPNHTRTLTPATPQQPTIGTFTFVRQSSFRVLLESNVTWLQRGHERENGNQQ